MRLIKTLRTHKKKVTFLVGASVLGGQYGYNKYCEAFLLRRYCAKISSHTFKPCIAEAKVRTIVVFMNPKAGGGKAAKVFYKFVAPMLHLTGIDFLVVPTGYEGHVGTLLKYLPSETEAIIVAGGDGALQEVVTSVMREKKVDLPIGFIPLGKDNTVCHRLLSPNHMASTVHKICNSVLAIAEGNIEPLPLLEITPEEGKPIYSVSYLTWGSIKDYIDSVPKFWWFGGLREYVAMLRYTMNSNCPSVVTGLLNEERVESSNITITPVDGGVSVSSWPVLQDKLHFIRNALHIKSQQDKSLLTTLSLVNDSTRGVSTEVVLDPEWSDSNFCVDGEEVDCRRVKIRYLTEGVRMFRPVEGNEGVGEVEVLSQWGKERWGELAKVVIDSYGSVRKMLGPYID